MIRTILTLITLISAQLCTAQILSFSPIVGGKLDCARYAIYYDAPENVRIKSEVPLLRPMKSALFGFSLNYTKKRSTYSVGMIFNDQVKTTLSYNFPAIINGESRQYSNKLNLGEKLVKIPLSYQLKLLNNQDDNSRLSLIAGASFIFFYPNNRNEIYFGDLEVFTLDNGTTLNNLTVQKIQAKVNKDKLKLSLEFGLGYTFKLGEKHQILSSITYEHGLMALSSNQIKFTGSEGLNYSIYNSGRGSSLHLKFTYPINLNFSK